MPGKNFFLKKFFPGPLFKNLWKKGMAKSYVSEEAQTYCCR